MQIAFAEIIKDQLIERTTTAVKQYLNANTDALDFANLAASVEITIQLHDRKTTT